MLALAELLDRERHGFGAPMLSVYAANDAQDPADRADWRVRLTQGFAAARDEARDASHAEREALQSAIRHVIGRMDALPIDLRFPGWVAFASADGVHYADLLPAPMPTMVRWAERACLAPYVSAVPREDRAVVAVVDSRSAAIYRLTDGTLDGPDTVHAVARSTPVNHMGTPPRPGYHPGTRGTTGTDAAERARQIGRARLLRSTVERLSSLAGPEAWILVGGIPEVASAVVSHMPPGGRHRTRVLPGLDVHAHPAHITERARQAVMMLRDEADLALVDDLDAMWRADGLARAGSAATLSALQVGAVGQLVVTPAFLWGGTVMADEAVRAAQRSDAAIVCVHAAAATRLDTIGGGIAARLRYQPSAWVPLAMTPAAAV